MLRERERERERERSLRDLNNTILPNSYLSNFINEAIMQIASHLFNKLNCEWGEFKITDLFEIYGSKTTPRSKLEKIGIGKYPYITTQATNNGIAGYYDYFTERENCLTIDSAVLGTCFYQNENFSASDHVEILKPKFDLDKNLAIFLCAIINKNIEIYGYSYTKKRSQTAIKKEKIYLPIDKFKKLNFDLMSNFIKEIQKSHTQKLINYYKFLASIGGGNSALKNT